MSLSLLKRYLIYNRVLANNIYGNMTFNRFKIHHDAAPHFALMALDGLIIIRVFMLCRLER
jgi:hypothetical protein